MKRLLATACLMLFAAHCVQAQETRVIRGEYTYIASMGESLERALQKAEEQARLAALGREFGYLVAETTVNLERNLDGRESSDFHIYGLNEVKGEWIADTRKPESSVRINEELRLLEVWVSVEGEARPVSAAKVDFTAKVQRLNFDLSDPEKYEAVQFRDGDDFYLYFRSPADGYVAVYLVTDQEETYCLLPYRKDRPEPVKVKGGREYVFFTTKTVENSRRSVVDEYQMTCGDRPESNRIYVVFSPNKFNKADDRASDDGKPRELSFGAFQRWLTRVRQYDTEMAVDIKSIIVR